MIVELDYFFWGCGMTCCLLSVKIGMLSCGVVEVRRGMVAARVLTDADMICGQVLSNQEALHIRTNQNLLCSYIGVKSYGRLLNFVLGRL
jgi:hypothetical protein